MRGLYSTAVMDFPISCMAWYQRGVIKTRGAIMTWYLEKNTFFIVYVFALVSLYQEKNPSNIRAYFHSIYLGRAEIDMWTRASNLAGGFGGLSSRGTSGEAKPRPPATQATRLGGPIKIWLSPFAHTGIKLDKTMKILRKLLKDSCKLLLMSF